MADAGVTVSPSELKFRFELRKQIPVTLTVNNGKDVAVAFKVKTTSPKKYIVRPSTGVVKAGGSADVQVIMQAQKEFPPDLNNCKDKFLVLTVPLPADTPTSGSDKPELPADLFDKSNTANITDIKLKVSLVAPPAPPSPVPEGDELESSHTSEKGGGFKTVDEGKYRSTLDDLAAATKEVNTLKEQIKKLMDEKTSLNDKIGELEMRAEGKPYTSPSSSTATAPRASGFTLLHLILVAILCFLVGHYT
jgi:hypothetical protein|mmetsp:Transcript_11725/g.21150  ORF Transcript_11725/g.21150 Transcript_11725/m.21150 type:complete len:249 (-) Transcript_11725:129-875(-)|eukprot:CAMPEP_0177772598 /NCGR_PEP_ID=MMETSP0491_2-20121128/12332_1 /TAXON_ID=63592 /ORGANISM="Tetraselmis chuii, Strain PLY429" /LENGTH=248 /DNA_ID=CAMNT_0019290467 /DNA_START=287 /DNA_END=1033 /DNA_ORIENTATION=-